MRTLVGLALFILVGCAGAKTARAPRASDRPLVVGYLASWGVRTKATRIADLPADRLTHVFYAFGLIGPDGQAQLGDACLDVGECTGSATAPTPGGNFAALRTLKARYPHLRVLPSLGGWLGSARFSDASLTDSTRKRFVSSVVRLFIGRHGDVFDGIDVDWEFPVAGGAPGNVERPVDRENFTHLLAEFRRQLDSAGARTGRRYALSIAASARPSEIANLEIARITPLLDFIGVMTYDYHSGGSMAHFNAPMFAAPGDPTPHLTTDSSMRTFLAAGVPKEKLLIGVPFFGKSYGNVAKGTDHGLYQRGGPAPAPWSQIDWRSFAQRAPERAGFVRRWSDAAQVPWLYNPATGVFITYEDSLSVAKKGQYVRERGLGGAIIWELGADDGTLLHALTNAMGARRHAR